jgi:excisionase family DNA binding protein
MGMATPQGAASEHEAIVMSSSEAAQFLGISTRTLERYVQESRIPYVPFPRRGCSRTVVRFLRSQLIQWLEQRTVRPARAARRDITRQSA